MVEVVNCTEIEIKSNIAESTMIIFSVEWLVVREENIIKTNERNEDIINKPNNSCDY
jgi:hypothetical protein